MDQLSKKIRSEQNRAIYRQLPASATGVAGSLLLIYILWGVHSSESLIAWFISVAIVNGIIAISLYVYYLKYGKEGILDSNWELLFIIYTLLTGAVWGSAGVIFYEAPVEYQLLIIVWLWALSAGMSTILVAHKPAFYIMLVLLLAPLIIRTAFDQDSFHYGLSVTTFLWMISLIFFHHNNYKTFLEAITLRFTNVELVSELTQQKKEAENSNLAKSQFLAAASHDLRQPLHAQALFLAELDQYVDDATGRRILGGLESSINSMRNLLNSILDISKYEAGVVDPVIEICSIDMIFNKLILEFEQQAHECGLDLIFKPCSLNVRSDCVLLESILRNFVSNAIRYTNKGRIIVGCRRKDTSVVIQVIDNGIGIPEDKQSDIFNPFVQLGNPERNREKGLGLGLSIVDLIAKLLDCSLYVFSESGKGSLFSVEVLRAGVSDMVKSDSTTTVKLASLNGIRVLIIDDEREIRTSLSGLLKSWGCIPVAVGSITELKKTLTDDENIFDVILSDFRLPGNEKGTQAISIVRKHAKSHIPAVLITGDTSAERLREANSSGYLMLHKPIIPNDLRTLLLRLANVY